MPEINITTKSEPLARSNESMPFGLEPTIPKPSSEYARLNRGVTDGANVGGSTQGRDLELLNNIFPQTTLGLDTYEPYTMYQSLLNGSIILEPLNKKN